GYIKINLLKIYFLEGKMKFKKVILTAAATAFILQASVYAADLTASYSMNDMTGLTYMGTVSNILGQKIMR
ncbi:MAG: hypothetical protein ACLU0Y_09120, partial [Hominilimicola sp.]